jgi:hypothetical protein
MKGHLTSLISSGFMVDVLPKHCCMHSNRHVFFVHPPYVYVHTGHEALR